MARNGSDPAGEPRQREGADPIADNPSLPRMDDEAARQTPAGGPLMDEHTAPASDAAGRDEMAPVPTELSAAPPPGGDYPPQQPRPGAGRTNGDGYLRLLLRVDDGEVSVVGASRVPGPLRTSGPLQGGLAYEVSIGPEQLGAGEVPDPGVRRGFAPPDDPARGHSVVEVPSYEFTARFPAGGLSPGDLPDLQVTVYRLDGGQAVPLPTLREQSGRATREVAALRGIRTEGLPQAVRVDLERALG
jgi:hypothetical protein